MKQDFTVAGYVRVSGEEQAERGLSLAHQSEKIEEFCKFKGWNLYRIYRDAGRSGGTIEKRPEFKQMLDDSKKGLFGALVVLKIDRFSRSARDLILTLDEFNKLGVGFISINENIDTSTAMGKTMLYIIGILAGLERELAKERTEAIQLSKVQKGEIVNRVPFGYFIKKKFDEDGNVINRRTLIIKSEAEIVRKIFESSKSIEDISKVVGVPEYKVKRILKNPFYCGKIKYKGKIYQGKHPIIIEEKVYNEKIPKA